MSVRIVPMTAETLPEARALVDSVFPYQTPSERLFFRVWERRDQLGVKLVLRLAGVADISDFWLALDDADEVLGTVGLYRLRKDSDEAVWLNWYCVSPKARGQGVGGRLLDFAIEEAEKSGVRFLRLYTSDHAFMARAQDVYESRGLEVYEMRNRVFYRLIRRQLELPRSLNQGVT